MGFTLKKNLRDTFHIANKEINETTGLDLVQLVFYTTVFIIVYKTTWWYLC